MAARILQFPGIKKTGSWRLQPSAIFWRSLAFLFPSFAVWQWHWQMALFASLLFMAFFLFFIPQHRLELLTKEAKKPPFEWLRKLLRDRRNVSVEARSSIFGNYANDGKGSWGKVVPEDDDGITIEDYLQQKKGSSRKPQSEKSSFEGFWKQNWTGMLGDKSYIFFGTSLLWGLLLYWGDAQYPSFMVLVWGLLYPLLEHWQNRKLFYALKEQNALYTDGLKQASKFFFLATELGSSLAIVLFIWPNLSGLWSLTFLMLLAVSIWFRMSLWQKLERCFPLYVYRALSCLSATVVLLS